MTEEGGVQLTAREREVCLLVAELKSAGTIAQALGISQHTVENHIYSAARVLPGKGSPMKKIIRFFSTRGNITG